MVNNNPSQLNDSCDSFFNTSNVYHYSCSSCNKKYKSKASLNLHLRLECGKEPKFFCPYCEKRCYQKGNLKVHILTKHKEAMKNSLNVVNKFL